MTDYTVKEIPVSGGKTPVYAVIDSGADWVFENVFAWEADALEWALELNIGRREV